ncbi:MAG: ABC transporter ATP-binding protein [Flammeovirgaceae bacterium]|nr:ABC transporter ATP-binding protein [Flammeovirgaceae bacterium]
MVRAVNIKKSYGHLQVLKGIDLTVNQSEVVAIIGPSGAGKSTLLHIIGTLDKPDQGELSFNHENVFLKSSKELATFRNNAIGFVFQFHNLLPEFTALENVMIPGLIGRRSNSVLKQRAEELLTMLKLDQRMHHKPSELSGGEQQRTAVARALINNPALILADEPSGNLDSDNANDLHRLFFDLRSKLGHTFIIVTHNKDFARMADRVVEMRDGMIL